MGGKRVGIPPTPQRRASAHLKPVDVRQYRSGWERCKVTPFQPVCEHAALEKSMIASQVGFDLEIEGLPLKKGLVQRGFYLKNGAPVRLNQVIDALVQIRPANAAILLRIVGGQRVRGGNKDPPETATPLVSAGAPRLQRQVDARAPVERRGGAVIAEQAQSGRRPEPGRPRAKYIQGDKQVRRCQIFQHHVRFNSDPHSNAAAENPGMPPLSRYGKRVYRKAGRGRGFLAETKCEINASTVEFTHFDLNIGNLGHAAVDHRGDLHTSKQARLKYPLLALHQ